MFSKIEDFASTSQGVWVKKFENKNISREASGDVWGGSSMPNGLPRALRTCQNNSTKNRNFREGSERPGGGRGDIGGTLAPHTDASNPQKMTFFTTQILTNFDPPGGVWATKPLGASAGIAKRNQFNMLQNRGLPRGMTCNPKMNKWL